MLKVKRRLGQSLVLDDTITITVNGLESLSQLGVEAPDDIPVVRMESGIVIADGMIYVGRGERKDDYVVVLLETPRHVFVRRGEWK